MTKITIEKINTPYVKFSSFLGYGVAIWKDDNEPEINHEYEIEFDIDELFEWGENINKSSENNIKIELENSRITFNAKIVSYEHDDSILTVSLENEIIFLEVSNFPDITGYISFSVQCEKVLIYPINL